MIIKKNNTCGFAEHLFPDDAPRNSLRQEDRAFTTSMEGFAVTTAGGEHARESELHQGSD